MKQKQLNKNKPPPKIKSLIIRLLSHQSLIILKLILLYFSECLKKIKKGVEGKQCSIVKMRLAL